MSNKPKPFGGNTSHRRRTFKTLIEHRFRQGNSPCHVLAIIVPFGACRPMRKISLSSLPGRRTPTPLQSEAPSQPTSRRLEHRRRRPVSPGGGPAGVDGACPGPPGCATRPRAGTTTSCDSRPGPRGHEWRGRRGRRARGGWIGIGRRRGRVGAPPALRSLWRPRGWKSATVTGSRSIQNPSISSGDRSFLRIEVIGAHPSETALRVPRPCPSGARPPYCRAKAAAASFARSMNSSPLTSITSARIRASGERPRSFAGVVVRYRLGPGATEDQATAAKPELARLGLDRFPTQRPCPGCEA